MLGTTKHWNNYQGMETVSSRTYVWPTEKFCHQIDPMAMVLLFNGFLLFRIYTVIRIIHLKEVYKELLRNI